MTALERKVREALIEKTAQETYELYTNDPEYANMLAELAVSFGEDLIKSIKKYTKDFDDGEMQELLGECEDKLMSQLGDYLKDPEKLRGVVYEQAKNQYLTSNELRGMLREHFKALRQDEDMTKEIMDKYEQSFEKLLKYTDVNEEIIRKLAGIAEEQGLEKAVQKETRYEIIREMFPTPEDYHNYRIDSMKEIIQWTQEVQSLMLQDGEVGGMLAGSFEAMGRFIQTSMDHVEKLYGGIVDKDIKEIYG